MRISEGGPISIADLFREHRVERPKDVGSVNASQSKTDDSGGQKFEGFIDLMKEAQKRAQARRNQGQDQRRRRALEAYARSQQYSEDEKGIKLDHQT